MSDQFEPLSAQQMARATLARQLLLGRQAHSAYSVIHHLSGLQAQQARPPFLGLWARIQGFQAQELTAEIHARRVVRATTMRGTLHLMCATDYCALRGAIQPGLTRGMRSVLRKRADGVDIDALVADGLGFFAEPAGFTAFRNHLLTQRPGCDERALAYIVRTHLPLIQAPAPSPWSFVPKSPFVSAAAFLAPETISTDPAPEALILRYLAAFGPATVADMRSWSGLAGLDDAFEALGPQLQRFGAEDGRVLFDLPDAPRPPADTTAPVRLLPAFDNLVLAHANRTRFIDERFRKHLTTKNLQVNPTFWIEGRVAGLWSLDHKRGVATVTFSPFETLNGAAIKDQLAAEAEAAARFAEPKARSVAVEFNAPLGPK